MPILTVEIVGETPAPKAAHLAQELAAVAATILESRLGGTWVKVHNLPATHYAENGPPLDVDDLPVFVSILHREPPAGKELERQVMALTKALANVLGRSPDRVHLEFLPGAAGRQSFGGRLVV